MGVKSIIIFYINSARGYLWLCGLLLFNSFLMSWEPFIFGKAKSWLVKIITKDGSLVISDFTYPLILLGIGLVLVEGLHCNKQILERMAFPYINKNILVGIYEKIQHMPYSFFQNNSIGTIISKLRLIKRNYECLFSDIVGVFALNSFMIIINISALAVIHKTLCLIMVIYCFMFVFISSFFLLKVNKCVVVENNVLHDIMGTIADKLANIVTIIVSNTFKKEKFLLEHNIKKDFITAEVRTYNQELKFLIFGGAFYVIMMVFIIYYTILLKITSQIDAGGVVLVVSLTVSISNAIWTIMENFSDIVEEVGELQSAFSIFDVKSCLICSSSQGIVKLGTDIAPSIEFRNVTFNYPGNDEESVVFDNFSLTIHHGEQVGIIGESGVGKTSLFSLLLKYFKPTSGEIFVNGLNLEDIDTESLMANISFIPQNISLFQRSIMDNLRYGHDDVPVEKIYEICKKINLHDSIMNMPDGYDTFIGECGGKISGGQRQRIAIARALIKRAKIILLDEATSALDLITESAIMESLELLYEEIKPTVITITHKLHTVKHMNRIILLKNGKIVEEGSHDSLLANHNSLYSNLWKIQIE